MEQFLVLTCVMLLAFSEVDAKRHKQKMHANLIGMPNSDESGGLEDVHDSVGSGSLDGPEGTGGFGSSGAPEDWESAASYSNENVSNGDWAGSAKVLNKKLRNDLHEAKNLNKVSRRAHN